MANVQRVSGLLRALCAERDGDFMKIVSKPLACRL
jgi:hypothetical protein